MLFKILIYKILLPVQNLGGVNAPPAWRWLRPWLSHWLSSCLFPLGICLESARLIYLGPKLRTFPFSRLFQDLTNSKPKIRLVSTLYQLSQPCLFRYPKYQETPKSLLTSAPWWRSKSTQSTDPAKQASCNGVIPSTEVTFTQASYDNNILITSSRPCLAATCNAVWWFCGCLRFTRCLWWSSKLLMYSRLVPIWVPPTVCTISCSFSILINGNFNDLIPSGT